jgi:sulfide:quinone oxidoreductase
MRSVGRFLSPLRGASGPRRVVIAGGGFAAIEALLALRALLGERVEVTLISASDRFAFRPAATLEPFEASAEREHSYGLAEIAADAGAQFRRDRLEAVAPGDRSVRLASGVNVRYDSLILALGARARVAIPGALTFRDQRDVPHVRELLEEMRAGALWRIVFAVPSGCAWPLPLFELAMLTAADASKRGLEVEISLVSPEAAPLELFGEQASRAVRHLLERRGVRFLGGSVPASVGHDGALQLHFGGAVPADRVVAVPQLRGPHLSGVPSRWWGFVPVDEEGRVEGLADVYAAGDMTAFPVKQGGLAAQQADVIARVIAAQEGVPVSIPPAVEPGRLLQAQLLGGELPLALRAELAADGVPNAVHGDSPAIPLSSALPLHEKVAGRHLRNYLARLAQLAT